ncbi:MAG: hypothetical protein WA130_01890 [Candidatus Methanoperedens sp.]
MKLSLSIIFLEPIVFSFYSDIYIGFLFGILNAVIIYVNAEHMFNPFDNIEYKYLFYNKEYKQITKQFIFDTFTLRR